MKSAICEDHDVKKAAQSSSVDASEGNRTVVTGTPPLIDLQHPPWLPVNLDPCTTLPSPLFTLTLELFNVDLILLVQRHDLSCEQHELGVRRIDVPVQGLRIGSGEIVFELQLCIEAGARARIMVAMVRVAEVLVFVGVADEAEGAGGIVAASGAAAGLRAGVGSRGRRVRGGVRGGERDGEGAGEGEEDSGEGWVEEGAHHVGVTVDEVCDGSRDRVCEQHIASYMPFTYRWTAQIEMSLLPCRGGAKVMDR